MKKELLVSIVILVSAVLADWEEPIKISRATINYTHGHFYDPDSGASYVFYSKNDYSSSISFFCQKKISPESKVLKDNCILQDRYVEDVDAAGKGNHLYVVYSARRKKNEVTCTTSNTEGCYDIYFTETKNAGETWSKPIPIPRTGYNWFHRRHPNLLYIEETNRLFVTYVLELSATMIFSYSTRPESSSIFSNEKEICRDSLYNDTDFKLISRKIASGTEIQFFYKNRETLYYLYSKNNGATWTKLERQPLSTTGIFSLFVPQSKKEVYLITQDGASTILSWEEENHEWNEREFLMNKYIPDFNSFVVSVPGKDKKALFSTYMAKIDPNIYFYDTEINLIEDLYEEAPMTPIDNAISFDYKGVKKARVLSKLGTDIYLNTYHFTE